MSAPASDDVWLIATLAPCSERPVFSTTMGTLRLRARLAGAGEGGNVWQALDVKADGRDARIGGKRFHHVMHADIDLIADGEHGGHGQATHHHGEIAGDVAGLGDERHAALDGFKARLVGQSAARESVLTKP